MHFRISYYFMRLRADLLLCLMSFSAYLSEARASSRICLTWKEPSSCCSKTCCRTSGKLCWNAPLIHFITPVWTPPGKSERKRPMMEIKRRAKYTCVKDVQKDVCTDWGARNLCIPDSPNSQGSSVHWLFFF